MPSSSTWSDVKTQFYDEFRDVTTSFIDPTELLRNSKRILSRMNDKQTFGFQETTGTLTLTGATSYNLETAFPGFKEIIAIQVPTGTTGTFIDMQSTPRRQFDVMPNPYEFCVEGTSTLKLSRTFVAPSSGTLQVIYYNRFMVLDQGGVTLKEYPVNDNDVFVFPERYVDVLVSGIAMLGFKKDRSHREDYTDTKEDFERGLLQMQMNEPRRVARSQNFAGAAF